MIKFFLLIIYSLVVFAIPNDLQFSWFYVGIGILALNLFVLLVTGAKSAKILRGIVGFLPFILITFGFNLILDTPKNAVIIAYKLIMVASMTILYASSVSVLEVAEMVAKILAPLRIFGLRTEDVKVMTSVALSLIPILKRDLKMTIEAAKAKNAPTNPRGAAVILTSFFTRVLLRVEQIENSLLAKGYEDS